MANSRLYFDDGLLYLNLSGGDPCHHVKKKRETIISFVCSSGYGDQDHGKPVFISEDDCTYFIVWHTSLVCERQVSSQATLAISRLCMIEVPVCGKNNSFPASEGRNLTVVRRKKQEKSVKDKVLTLRAQR